ncbi:MAG TPA: porin, partial [Noviherbaspirillum sp.]|nr:porin [Noviherbaspirillum sp.]
MKKSLFALAVLGAFAGAASAQTSVTVYGVADISLAKARGVSTQMSSAGLLNNGTSRLGFRGTEDLGGGLRASFNFEQGIDLEQGNLSQDGGGAWGRAANMSLGGAWGTLSMG